MSDAAALRAIIAEEAKKTVRAELATVNSKIIELDNMLKRVYEKITNLERSINVKVEQVVNAKEAERVQANNLQLVEMKNHLNSIVTTEIKPQIDTLRRYVAEQTLDGTELVTQYRRRVMSQHGGRGGPMITDGRQNVPASNTPQFVFTNED